MKRCMRSAGYLAALASTVTALLLGGMSGMAGAATNWDATGTSADIVGAHAWGTIDAADRFILKVTLRDTKGDSHGARVYVRTTYADGGTRLENLSAAGAGATKSKTWNYASSARKFQVQECLTEGGATYDCAGWSTIYPR